MKWAAREVQFLRENAKTMSYVQIAKKLHRSPFSVDGKACKLRIERRQLRKKRLYETLCSIRIAETTKAYLAASVDGEGCIRLTKHRSRSDSSRFYFTPMVIILNTNLEWLHSIQKDLSFGTVYAAKKAYKPNWRLSHRFQVTGTRAKWFLEQIQVYLRIKRKLADILLELPDFNFTDELNYAIHEKAFQEITFLNRRGKMGQLNLPKL